MTNKMYNMRFDGGLITAKWDDENVLVINPVSNKVARIKLIYLNPNTNLLERIEIYYNDDKVAEGLNLPESLNRAKALVA